jgi:2-keto-4-pentenoate hydratase
MDEHGKAEAAAAAIADARLAGRPLARLPEAIRPTDEAAAYRVQAALHHRLEAAGHGAPVGHKIGCTTLVMQRYLGIGNPCAGGVFPRTVHEGEAVLDSGRFQRLGVECEIAVRLGADPAGEASDAIAAVMAAIEIVEDRYDDFRRFDTPTLIADDFFSAGCVLAKKVEAWRELDLEAVEGRMRINGEEVGRGEGRDILGHPLNAFGWLRDNLASRGRTFRPGEFVLLGSLVQTVWLNPGDRVEIEVDGLGGAGLLLR